MLRTIAFLYTRQHVMALLVAPMAVMGVSSRCLHKAAGERSLMTAGHEAAACFDTVWHQALPSRHPIYIFKNSLEQFANLSFISQRKHNTLFYLLYPTGGHLVVYSWASSFGCITHKGKVFIPDTMPCGHRALPPATEGQALLSLPPVPGWMEGFYNTFTQVRECLGFD